MNPALKVTILEKSNKLLSKVKVSGGGRCNVTHACFDIADMSKQYPRGQHFVKKACKFKYTKNHKTYRTAEYIWRLGRHGRLKTPSFFLLVAVFTNRNLNQIGPYYP